MKKINFIAIVAIIVSISLPGCEPDRKTGTENTGPDTTGNTSVFDWKTMLTPRGEKLKPSEEGPVRSALGEPIVELATFELEISGLVDSSYLLTWDDIQAFPAVYTDTMLMYCVEGWEVFGKWKGILVKDLLDKARVKTGGEYILFSSVDGYKTALSIAYLEKYNAMLAYEVNGAPLKVQNGFPLRLIAYGKLGYKWAKWVNKLEAVNQLQAGYWESFGYSERADVSVKRRIYYEGQDTKPLDY